MGVRLDLLRLHVLGIELQHLGTLVVDPDHGMEHRQSLLSSGVVVHVRAPIRRPRSAIAQGSAFSRSKGILAQSVHTEGVGAQALLLRAEFLRLDVGQRHVHLTLALHAAARRRRPAAARRAHAS
jgi:hypothetical protein